MFAKLLKNVKGEISLRKAGVWIITHAAAIPFIVSGQYSHAAEIMGAGTAIVGIIHKLDK